MNDISAYCAANSERFVNDLIAALHIPSISADPAHAGDVCRNAEQFVALARTAGFTAVELLETDGHPAVYAELITDPTLPTALIYGHHDVQPVDPLEEWISPPFTPTIRNGALYGRGAVDDKGQLVMHLKAVEAFLATRGTLPLNLKFIMEGEEEIGSAHFDSLVQRERERLRADVVVVSDTAFFARDTPSLCIGLRGLALLEVTVQGPTLDLHSGVFGGAIANPVEMLARMIASLKDPVTNRVTVPSFYDDVEELSPAMRDSINQLPFDAAAFQREAGGVPALTGEAGYSVLEQRWTRPTLEINGIWGGYSGPGAKTIIPASASAKISCRLVPNQDPERIAALVGDALQKAAPPGVTVSITIDHGGKPVVVDETTPLLQAASRAVAYAFGKPPMLTREGGSIPPVETFQRVLGVPTLLMGFGLPDDQIHAPNEKFDLDQYQKGILAVAALWDEIGKLPVSCDSSLYEA